MTMYKSRAATSVGTEPALGADAAGDLQRRAMHLFVGAEPHADVVPCDLHLRQALSQLSLIERPEENTTVMEAETTPGLGRH